MILEHSSKITIEQRLKIIVVHVDTWSVSTLPLVQTFKDTLEPFQVLGKIYSHSTKRRLRKSFPLYVANVVHSPCPRIWPRRHYKQCGTIENCIVLSD